MIFNFDSYTFKARLASVFILLIPFSLAVFAWFPETLFWQSLPTAFSIPVIFALLFSELGRDMGKKKEHELFKKWGGMPTDKIISLVNSPLDKTTVLRYRSILENFLPQLKLPTFGQEIKNPEKSIEIYKSCANYLREKTRDKKIFSILFAENVSYGFRRNLWAMKPAGIFISVFTIFIILVKIIISTMLGQLLIIPMVCMLVDVVLLTWWVLRINPKWVEITANVYAKQLFAACDVLEK